MPKLIICPDGDPGSIYCGNCPCAVPHYEAACPSANCMSGIDCQLIDEEQRLEAEEEYREHCTWFHGMYQEWLNQWAEQCLEESSSLIFKQFNELRPLPENNPNKTIKFRRYGEFAADPRNVGCTENKLDHWSDALQYGMNCPKFEK